MLGFLCRFSLSQNLALWISLLRFRAAVFAPLSQCALLKLCAKWRNVIFKGSTEQSMRRACHSDHYSWTPFHQDIWRWRYQPVVLDPWYWLKTVPLPEVAPPNGALVPVRRNFDSIIFGAHLYLGMRTVKQNIFLWPWKKIRWLKQVSTALMQLISRR